MPTYFRGLPAVRQSNGAYLISCPNPAHEDKNPSCLVSENNDNGSLRFFCFAGCIQSDILAGANEIGMFGGDSFNNVTSPLRSRSPKSQTTEYASEIVRGSRPANSCSIVRKYWKRRGLSLPMPSDLRAANVWNSEVEQLCPALVGVVRDPASSVVKGCHVTYLDRKGRKAQVATSKKMFGSVLGGVVPLGRPKGELAIAEGIESAASFQQLTSVPTWACLSTAGMKALMIPQDQRSLEIILAGDNDPPGRKAANAKAQSLAEQGFSVKVIFPEIEGQDWNDVLMGGGTND